MISILDIITVTKDDPEGVLNTVRSTSLARANSATKQIIIDSSNETNYSKVKELIERELNIVYARQAPLGISSAFNLGLSLAKAEWIWFLNGRDEIHPDLDIEHLRYVLNRSSADAIIFELESMQSHDRHRHPPMWELWPPTSCWIPHPATIVRRKLFEEYGGFNESYKIAMDVESWLRFFSNRVTVDMISIPVALYDESGISSMQRRLTAKEVKKIIMSNLPLHLNIWLRNGLRILNLLRYWSKLSRSG